MLTHSPNRSNPNAQYTIEMPSCGPRLFVNLTVSPKDPPRASIVQSTLDRMAGLGLGHDAMLSALKAMIEDGRLNSRTTEAQVKVWFPNVLSANSPFAIAEDVPYVASSIEDQLNWLQSQCMSAGLRGSSAKALEEPAGHFELM